MRIGELSKRSGFSRDTIRYYQELGLFQGQVKQGENNYRQFTNEAIEILKLIEESKEYGFTLRENKALLKVRDNKLEKLTLMNQLVTKKISKSKEEIELLELRIQKLNSLSKELDHCMKHCI